MSDLRKRAVTIANADEYIDKGHFQMARNITRAATAALVKT